MPESLRFQAYKDTNTGSTVTYARVTLVDNLARNGRVILVAGQSVSATEMAGELLLRPDSAQKVLKMLGLLAGTGLSVGVSNHSHGSTATQPSLKGCTALAA